MAAGSLVVTPGKRAPSAPKKGPTLHLHAECTTKQNPVGTCYAIRDRQKQDLNQILFLHRNGYMHIFCFPTGILFKLQLQLQFLFCSNLIFRKLQVDQFAWGVARRLHRRFFFYAHRNPQGRQLVWNIVCATSTFACVQPCRPSLTKSLEKNKHFGCMTHKILGQKTSILGA